MENLSTGSLMRLKVSLSKQMWWSIKWISFFFAISSHQWHIYGGMGSYKYFHSYYLHNKLMFHVPMTWLHIDCNLGQDATDRHASITTSQQQSYFLRHRNSILITHQLNRASQQQRHARSLFAYIKSPLKQTACEWTLSRGNTKQTTYEFTTCLNKLLFDMMSIVHRVI